MLIKADVRRKFASASNITRLITFSSLGLLFVFAACNAFATVRLTITHNLPLGTVANAYSGSVSASGGQSPYLFAIQGGALAPGLTLNPATGLISGTPTQAGRYLFTVVATDTLGIRGDRNLTLSIEGNGITVSISPTGISVPSAGSQQFTAYVTGTSNSGVHWSTSAGSINTSGLLTAPNVTASTNVIVTAVSAADASKSASAQVTVEPQSQNTVAITTTSLVEAFVGHAYSQSLSASGGTPPYRWSYSGCPTSIGLSCNNLGIISGTPSSPNGSPFTITLTAKDSASRSSSPVALVLGVTTPGNCGPTANPPYPCSTHRLDSPIYPTTPNVGGSTGYNTVVFPYTKPSDYYYPSSGTGNGITRMTDANTAGGNSCGTTTSGGTADNDFDLSNSYMSVACKTGAHFIMSLTTNGSGYIQNGLTSGNINANGIKFTKFGNFSQAVAKRYWSVEANSSGGNVVNLVRHDLSGTTSISSSDTIIYNLMNCPGIPNPFPLSGGGLPIGTNTFSSDHTDNRFQWGIGPTSGQNSITWVIVYDQSLNQCASLNIITGQYWAFCPAGSCQQNGNSPTGTIAVCPSGYIPKTGIHTGTIAGNGDFSHWDAACQLSGGGGGQSSDHYWRIGTSTIVNGLNPQHIGHASPGYANVYGCEVGNKVNQYQDIEAALSSETITSATYFNYPATFNGHSCHGYQVFRGIDGSPTYNTSGGASTGVTPGPLTAEAYITRVSDGVVSRLSPTFSNFSLPGTKFGARYGIGHVSQDGTIVCWESNWNGALGTDSSGNPRSDVFCMSKLQ